MGLLSLIPIIRIYLKKSVMSVKKKRKMIKLDMNKVSVKHSLFFIQCETRI